MSTPQRKSLLDSPKVNDLDINTGVDRFSPKLKQYALAFQPTSHHSHNVLFSFFRLCHFLGRIWCCELVIDSDMISKIIEFNGVEISSISSESADF